MRTVKPFVQTFLLGLALASCGTAIADVTGEVAKARHPEQPVSARNDRALSPSLTGINLLSCDKQDSAAKLLYALPCLCGANCGLSVGTCAEVDTTCPAAHPQAAAIIDSVNRGESAELTVAASEAAVSFRETPPAMTGPHWLDRPTVGSVTAPTTGYLFLDYLDPQAPTAMAAAFKRHEQSHGHVRFVVKQSPLRSDFESMRLAHYATIAQSQGLYWHFSRWLLRQPSLPGQTEFEAWLCSQGIDEARMVESFDSVAARRLLQEDINDAAKLFVSGRSALLLDGSLVFP